MRKLGLFGAVGLIFISSPAVAQSGMLMPSGDVSIGGQFTSWVGEGDYTPESGIGLDARGRLMVPLGDSFSVQIDAGFETTPDIYTLTQSVFVGGHLSWRDPEQFMLGVIGGAGNSVIDDGEDYRTFLLGVEGQFYLDDTTIFKQAGVIWGDEDGSEELQLLFVRGGVRHFFGDGWTADGEVGFATGTFYDEDVWIATWGAGLEKQLDTETAISIFGRYQGAYYYHDDCSATMVEQRIMGGVRVAFGTPDAKTQDRYGANADLPRFATFSSVDGLEYC